jgi:Flp pilus assembly secretin CpaC
LSLADSKVADVVVANTHEILVNGKAIGFTTVVVWDENNRSTTYDVVVRGPFSDEQIELQVKVAEINRTKAQEYGIDMLYQDSRAPPARTQVGSRHRRSRSRSSAVAPRPRTSRWRCVTRPATMNLQAMIHALEDRGVLKCWLSPTSSP